MLTRSMTREELRALIVGKIPAYDHFYKVSDKYFEVIQNCKHGILNSKFNMVLQPIYEEVIPLKNGLIIASRVRGLYEIFSEWGIPVTSRVFTRKEEVYKYASFF